jgi:hypothetical protein
VFFEEIPPFASPPQSITGATSIALAAGEPAYASAYAEIFGTASLRRHPGPHNASGSLPLLAGAIGGLAA